MTDKADVKVCVMRDQQGQFPVFAVAGIDEFKKRFADRIEKIRSLMPDAFIGIDVITGFPGEKEEHFHETYDLLARLRPAFLHIFPFSERPGTPAVTMPDKVQSSISTARVARLEELCSRLHNAFATKFLGTEREVLFESTDRNGLMYGYTDNYLRVAAPYQTSKINTICRVKLGSIDANGDISCEIVG